MDEATLAYTAGLFDGEGCIQIRRTEPTRPRDCGKVSHRLHATLTNTDGPVLDWMVDTHGGALARSGYLRKRQPYRWIVTGPDATAFLERHLPYLRIKRAQAEIAIEFGRLVAANGRRHLTPEVLAARELLWRKLLECREPENEAIPERLPALARGKKIGGTRDSPRHGVRGGRTRLPPA